MSVPAILLHVFMYWLPESPRWLVQQDREGDALKVLARLRSNGDLSAPGIRAELQEITSKISWENQNPAPSYGQMLLGSEKRRTWLGIGIQFMQQVTGINVSVFSAQHARLGIQLIRHRIMYYAVFLFEQAGINGTQAALLANGIQGVVLNVFVWPNMYWMDKWGRRRPMIIGGIGMGVSMLLIGTLMAIIGEFGSRITRKMPDANSIGTRPSPLRRSHSQDCVFVC